MAFVQLLRPHQWVKNVFIFAGLVFGQKLFDPGAVTKAMLGFLLLSLVSSTIYI
ncbi:MAG: decaprenyl-phosphate phosphoribosyltransferase, partial [Planctomycetes bacterium]|nr:decaprenyl-phosphate phosphoribosyltransferase [Planctomycetota bacterium]